jgi:hypothetical protein
MRASSYGGSKMINQANIWMQAEDGTMKGISCHHDGQIDHLGRILARYFNSTALAEALINVGPISFINDTADIKRLDNTAFIKPHNEEPLSAATFDAVRDSSVSGLTYYWNEFYWIVFTGVTGEWSSLEYELAENHCMQKEPLTGQTGWENEVRKEGEVTYLHKHEIMDRISVINHMFNDVVLNHTAVKSLTQEKVDRVSAALADLYQDAGAVCFKED